MSHSKRNTSLAFFTSHERSLLRSSWGTQTTRLTRDSFLPFGYCRLCLGYANSPVACGEGNKEAHLFCRECALNDLMAQRKEIKRLEREAEMREREEREEKAREEEESRKRELERFERTAMGFADDGIESTGKKRKREAEELHAHSSELQRNGEGSEKNKKTKSSEASFWVPGSDSLSASNTTTSKSKQQKLHPLCPASTPEDKHGYSLKSLITVNFAEIEPENRAGGGKADEPTRVCPSCKKALTNTSRPMLGTADGCGHVICGACADLFLVGTRSNGVSSKRGDTTNPSILCYVCEADLSGPSPGAGDSHDKGGKDKKQKHKEGKHSSRKVGRLVEISCEGTGFAGGGSNVAKREGVAFQC
ncbi:uncharacterized protein PV07_08457 [Cladophialophora immunda]|uniref:Zinc finger RING-type eukaryotic domain-containing protein n=1 Tax=Cladophialophora immunda TaxID=569365 RepID=A0A0D1ZBZ1_9EURO|nr:uncharacterized protein PV07_08457 [Cladophialophora immunda]KIW25266.1 hypothetical protein PV07_08457 [Cladophialophora immunda]